MPPAWIALSVQTQTGCYSLRGIKGEVNMKPKTYPLSAWRGVACQ